MNTITSARDLFTDYRLRHPVYTTALAVTAVLGALYMLRRGRNPRSHSLLANLLVIWPLKITAVMLIGSVIMVAAGVYLAPRGYRWARDKWETRA